MYTGDVCSAQPPGPIDNSGLIAQDDPAAAQSQKSASGAQTLRVPVWPTKDPQVFGSSFGFEFETPSTRILILVLSTPLRLP